MAQILRTEQAQQDLESILDHLDSQSIETGDRFAERFDQTCELHATHPQLGASAEEYAPNLRLFTVWNYTVFYRPIDGGIELIRIIHGARDIPKLFQ
jgi:toxin ParE1/3/4